MYLLEREHMILKKFSFEEPLRTWYRGWIYDYFMFASNHCLPWVLLIILPYRDDTDVFTARFSYINSLKITCSWYSESFVRTRILTPSHGATTLSDLRRTDDRSYKLVSYALILTLILMFVRERLIRFEDIQFEGKWLECRIDWRVGEGRGCIGESGWYEPPGWRGVSLS